MIPTAVAAVDRKLAKRAHDRAYAASHREERLAYGRMYRATHREERRARDRAYYAAHPERRIAKGLPPPGPERERIRELLRIRRARHRTSLAGAVGSHTAAEWAAEVAWWGGRCAYCGRADRPLTREHVIPLIRGGSDNIDNIVPACLSCNARKGDRAA